MPAFGVDDRQEVYETGDARIRALADSTVALFNPDVLGPTDGKEYAPRLVPYDSIDDKKLSPKEKFYGQPSGSSCSGALIGKDLVLTAGHCMPKERCFTARFVFGFSRTNAQAFPSRIPAGEVYGCGEVLARVSALEEGWPDWALIRLDRPVLNRRPLELNRAGKVAPGAPVFAIGYPKGLTAKVMSPAPVRKVQSHTFTANIDIFHGNSGSPVFNAETSLIEGLVVGIEGKSDEFDELPDGIVHRARADDSDQGAIIMRIADILPAVAAAETSLERKELPLLDALIRRTGSPE